MPNKDEVKGRAKQAAGIVTGNKDLEREGKTDRAAGRVKEVLGDLKEKAEDAVDAVKDKIHDAADRE